LWAADECAKERQTEQAKQVGAPEEEIIMKAASEAHLSSFV
jgi:hypothetical protein